MRKNPPEIPAKSAALRVFPPGATLKPTTLKRGGAGAVRTAGKEKDERHHRREPLPGHHRLGQAGGEDRRRHAENGVHQPELFERNYAECRRLGIPVGAYYYTYARDAAAARAELAKLREALAGKTFTLPIAVDVEDNKLKPLSADALTDLVILAADTIESWGLYAMVYTYTYYSQTELAMDRLSAYDLWIADYRGTRPTRKHGMWQYTSKGSLPGISGNVDKNHVYKDYPSIITRAGLTCLRG